MASRNEGRAAAAVKRLEIDLAERNQILGQGTTGHVKFIKCDLGSIASAKAAAEEFLTKEQRLDVLSTHL